jgi:hypothetical protein
VVVVELSSVAVGDDESSVFVASELLSVVGVAVESVVVVEAVVSVDEGTSEVTVTEADVDVDVVSAGLEDTVEFKTVVVLIAAAVVVGVITVLLRYTTGVPSTHVV